MLNRILNTKTPIKLILEKNKNIPNNNVYHFRLLKGTSSRTPSSQIV